jgi:hypothetical protein
VPRLEVLADRLGQRVVDRLRQDQSPAGRGVGLLAERHLPHGVVVPGLRPGDVRGHDVGDGLRRGALDTAEAVVVGLEHPAAELAVGVSEFGLEA